MKQLNSSLYLLRLKKTIFIVPHSLVIDIVLKLNQTRIITHINSFNLIFLFILTHTMRKNKINFIPIPLNYHETDNSGS